MTRMDEDTVAALRRAPDAEYDTPLDVVEDGRLSHRQKHGVLQAWARACREEVAAAEAGLAAGARVVGKRLDEIERALQSLAMFAGGDARRPEKLTSR